MSGPRAPKEQSDHGTTVTQEDRRYHAFASAVLKAEEGGELGPGEFTATASVFDVIDSYGEVVRKGAFAESIAQMKASGDPIPIVWQHDWHDPFSHIGYIKSIQETETALLYHGVLDIADNPKAAQVYRLMKGRRVMQQSFGYDVLAGGRATVDGVDVYEITNVKLHEVGPCLVGVNNNTRLLGIKSSDGTDVRAVPVAPSATTSGQAETTITEDPTIPASVPEVEPASVPEPSAVKSISPASALLFADIFDIPEGE
jgi:HK97 family phage prohead protease